MRTDCDGYKLRIMYVPCGYLTEDDKCGYYELGFVVKDDWLKEWFKANCKDCIAENISLEDWLRAYYTGEDARAVYEDACKEGEVVCEQKDWRKESIFYEVWEETVEKGEHEWNTILRAESLWDAKKAFKKAKEDAMTDSVLAANPENITEDFEDYENGDVRIVYDGGSYFYGLYLSKRKVKLEEK